MNGNVRRHNVLNRLCEETELFKETSLNDINEIKNFLLEFRHDTEEKIKRLVAGHKQLIDWIGMQFNCYIPKDLCLLNLTLMGITVDVRIWISLCWRRIRILRSKLIFQPSSKRLDS